MTHAAAATGRVVRKGIASQAKTLREKFETFDSGAIPGTKNYAFADGAYADAATNARFAYYQACTAAALVDLAPDLQDAARYRALRGGKERFRVMVDNGRVSPVGQTITGRSLDDALDNIELVKSRRAGLSADMRKIIDGMMNQPQRQAWRHYHKGAIIDRLEQQGLIRKVSSRREQVVRYALTVLGAETWARMHRMSLDYS